MINVNTKLTGDLSGAIERFGRAVQDKVTIAGVAAMARVIYDEAKEKCPVSAEAHYFHGSSFKKTGKKYLFQPGTLKAAIYRTYSPERSNYTIKTYKVAWNHKKAPYGFMVEYGTSRATANPFMRPAFSRVQDAISAGKVRMGEKISEITAGT
jgi:HK97 gp10 family phage protein